MRGAGAGMSGTLIVVPCWNEARRLPVERFQAFLAAEPDVGFVFVDDGSTDATRERLRSLEKDAPERVRVLALDENRGKAEAVRRGVLEAMRGEPRFVGYWDADLATPLEVIPEFRRELEARPACEIVMAARVHLLGRRIQRSALRHYLGRVSATLIALALGLRVYDTQCGAKLLRNGPQLAGIFREPFLAGWLFDVEILMRRIAQVGAGGRPTAEEVIYEYPIPEWTDVSGSKLRPGAYLRAAFDLLRIRRRYRRAC
ncbi:MAG TPA: glycosyltransferase [Myxococcota bacterium]|jgi:glycosyltransferase involved in cell wall biosynthesis